MPNNAIQLWSPDTCGCIIHLAYDDTLPPEQRTLTYVTEEEARNIHMTRLRAEVEWLVERRKLGDKDAVSNTTIEPQPTAKLCPAHSLLGHTPARFAQVMSENNSKNIAFKVANDLVPTLQPKDFKWSFDAGRKLHAEFPTLSASDRSRVAAGISSKLGAGKVAFENM